MGAQPRLVGRAAEQHRLLAALDAAMGGAPAALLVHGEPGIGKTSLVRHLVSGAQAKGVHTLFGQCLRFGSDVTSFAPFGQAVTNWLHSAPAEDRLRVFHGAHSLAAVVPALGGGDQRPGIALFQLGAALDRLSDDRPTLLVIDDLQWADPSSLDVLSYVIAGFTAGQHMSVIGTYRDTELVEGHRLHGWLADVLRMPFVERMPLTRLDAWETEQLVLELAGASRIAIAAEVHQRSGGNPYLAELLVGASSTRAGDGQGGAGLTDTLLAAWHRLSPKARRVTQLLSVSGRPVTVPVLNALAGHRGIAAQQVVEALAEANGHGITVVDDSGDAWFRHPLLADVVVGTLPPWALAELHRGYAEAWVDASGVTERERAQHLALHYAAAGEPDQAFDWSLQAADGAGRTHALGEEARHLLRAVTLLPSLSSGRAASTKVTELLTRTARVCDAVGDYREALEHYERALARIDRTADPHAACRLLLPLQILRDVNAVTAGGLSLAEPREALRLLEGQPPSEEHALALTHLAYAEVFRGIPSAARHAEEAVRIAEQLQTPVALSWALATRAQTKWGTEDGVADARRSFELATASDDAALLARAAINLSNSYGSTGFITAAADVVTQTYEVVRDKGRYGNAASVGGVAAQWNLVLGRWQVARPLVREILAFRQQHPWGASARCTASILAALSGEMTAAGMHLDRAQALMPNPLPVGDDLIWAEMQYSIAVGNPRRTLDLAEAHIAEAMQVDPMAADEFLQWAARAAADLAVDNRDGSPGDAIARLARIESLRGEDPPPFHPAGPRDAFHPALKALYAAQRAECHGDSTALVGLWEAAAAATELAELQYENARSLYFLGRALLKAGHSRSRAAEVLSRARGAAVDLGAAPLVDLIDLLSMQTHLALTGTVPEADVPGSGHQVSTVAGARLTPREQEVLGHIMAGETYSQIASALFISEKTVSVHVSNLLHKTGTVSRVDLAAAARRSAGHPGVRPGPP